MTHPHGWNFNFGVQTLAFHKVLNSLFHHHLLQYHVGYKNSQYLYSLLCTSKGQIPAEAAPVCQTKDTNLSILNTDTLTFVCVEGLFFSLIGSFQVYSIQGSRAYRGRIHPPL